MRDIITNNLLIFYVTSYLEIVPKNVEAVSLQEKKSSNIHLHPDALPEKENTVSQFNPNEYDKNKSVEEEREKSHENELNSDSTPSNDSQFNTGAGDVNNSVEEEQEKSHENKFISDSNVANESSSTTMDCSNIVTNTDQIEEENILARGQLETCEESSTVESIGM